jgi:hypothetical protein
VTVQVIFQKQSTSPHHNNIKDIIKDLTTAGARLFTNFYILIKRILGFWPFFSSSTVNQSFPLKTLEWMTIFVAMTAASQNDSGCLNDINFI